VSETLAAIAALVAKGAVHVSDHAFEEMRKDDILPSDIVDGLSHAQVVEDYPDANRGSSVLVRLLDRSGRPLHAVWGIPKRRSDIAVLVTAYRPDPESWTDNFLKRTKP
jgi:Domain of unknown function (DUF4258)